MTDLDATYRRLYEMGRAAGERGAYQRGRQHGATLALVAAFVAVLAAVGMGRKW